MKRTAAVDRKVDRVEVMPGVAEAESVNTDY